MSDKPANIAPAVGATEDGHSATEARDSLSMPPVVDRVAFQTQLDALRVREQAHTHEGRQGNLTRNRWWVARLPESSNTGESPQPL